MSPDDQTKESASHTHTHTPVVELEPVRRPCAPAWLSAPGRTTGTPGANAFRGELGGLRTLAAAVLQGNAKKKQNTHTQHNQSQEEIYHITIYRVWNSYRWRIQAFVGKTLLLHDGGGGGDVLLLCNIPVMEWPCDNT